MKKIEVSFCWSDLDELSKRTIFSVLAPFLSFNYPFERADAMFTWVECELVLFLESGIPCLRVSDKTKFKIQVLTSGCNN